jgi:hypothetical protein
MALTCPGCGSVVAADPDDDVTRIMSDPDSGGTTILSGLVAVHQCPEDAEAATV